MHQTGKLAQVVMEMNRYRMDVIGISEARWTGSGMVKERSRHAVIHSGRNDNQHAEGVVIIMSEKQQRHCWNRNHWVKDSSWLD